MLRKLQHYVGIVFNVFNINISHETLYVPINNIVKKNKQFVLLAFSNIVIY
jgi:hypothetical protein